MFRRRRVLTIRCMILLITCIWIVLLLYPIILIINWKAFESSSSSSSSYHHQQQEEELFEMINDRTVPKFNENHSSVTTTTTTATRTSKLTITTTARSSIRYTVDPVCTNCRYVDADEWSSCQMQITTLVLTPKLVRQLTNQSRRVNVTEAATIVSTIFPNNCYRCNIDNGCNKIHNKENYYYRLDDLVLPYIEKEVSHYIQSIDTNYRLPTNLVHNPIELSYYFNQSQNVYPNKRYVFEFNPSIVQLPNNQIPYNLPDARYLVSYRVSTLHACISNPIDQLNMIGGQWYLRQENIIDDIALALLDENFTILTENVFDIRSTILYRGQDYRLFNFNNQLYINTFDLLVPIWIVPPPLNNNNNNNETTLLQHVRNGQNISVPFHEATVRMPLSKVASTKKSSSLSSLTSFKVYIRTMISGSHEYYSSKFGKNLNFFMDPYTGQIIMETYPMGIKERYDPNVEAIVPIDPKRMNNTTNHSTNEIIQELLRKIMVSPDPNNTAQKIWPSYGTTDELEMSKKRIRRLPYTAERGSACCVLIQDPRRSYRNNNNNNNNNTATTIGTNQQSGPTTTNTTAATTTTTTTNESQNTNRQSFLLLGISHSKTRRDGKMKLIPNQFFSTFYVMEAFEPYNVVARTGRFCLGSTLMNSTNYHNQESDHNTNNTNDRSTVKNNDTTRNRYDATPQLLYDNNSTRTTNPYLRMSLTSSGLIIGDEVYTKCPKIHFVMGMTTKVDDPTKLIITYGINDCTSHMVVLDLQHVIKLLFQPYSLVDPHK